MVRYIVTEQARAERTQYGIAAITERKRVDQIDDVALTLEETMRLVCCCKIMAWHRNIFEMLWKIIFRV